MRNIICTLVLLSLFGCKERRQDCSVSSPGLIVHGYDTVGLDSIQIAKYQKGSDFALVLGSRYIGCAVPNPQYGTYPNSFMFYGLNDSMDYRETFENFDWKFTILSTGETLKITNAKRQFKTTSYNHPDACVSGIFTADVNGKIVEDSYFISEFIIGKP